MRISARRISQLLLLAQATAALLIGWALLGHGAAPWAALLAGVGAVVGVRLAINLNNFALAARFGSATPDGFRLGPRARLRLVAEEFCASMLVSNWLMARASAATRIHPGSACPPVLLLHGYGCNSGYWTHLTPLLDAARISHATVDLEPVVAGIDDYVPAVERAVQALCAAAGAPQVVIVAHSMGGLVARAWMRTHGHARVARLVTLGTPHHGTALARLGLGQNAVQMRLEGTGKPSDWLRLLADSEDATARALVTSIYTHHDNIVSPQTSSVLPGARNVEFGGIGHVALGANPRVLAQVMREISAVAAQSGR